MSYDQSSRDVTRSGADATTYVGLALRWWWLLLTALIGGAIVGHAASSLIAPTYQSSATLLVSQQQIPGVTQRNDVETSLILSNTFTRLITLGPVISRAIEQGGLAVSVGEFRESISVESAATSPLIDIIATNVDPQLAQDMVNVLAQVFIASPELQLAGGAGAVTIVAPAELPGGPVSPSPTLNAILGGTLALIAALLLVVLFEHLKEQRTAARMRLNRRVGVTPAPVDADAVELPPTDRPPDRRVEPRTEAPKGRRHPVTEA